MWQSEFFSQDSHVRALGFKGDDVVNADRFVERAVITCSDTASATIFVYDLPY
jgi:hypothetical protein